VKPTNTRPNPTMFQFLTRRHKIAKGRRALDLWAKSQGIKPIFISPDHVGAVIYFTLAVPTDADVAQLGDPLATLQKAGLRNAKATVVSQETIDRDYEGNWYYWFK
jgi:hypothetical protein